MHFQEEMQWMAWKRLLAFEKYDRFPNTILLEDFILKSFLEKNLLIHLHVMLFSGGTLKE